MLQAVLLPGILVFLLGLADDAFRLGEAIKLALQVLIAAGTVLLGGVVLRSIDVPGLGEVGLGGLAVPLTIVWVVGMVNVYNFMDGLDGLVGGGGVIAAGWLLLLFSLHGAPELGLVSLLLGTGIAGFLLFNFPPARIFMGDSGSSFVGFLFAILAIFGAQTPSPGIPFPVFLLLFGAFLADTSVTLVRRMMRGEPWYKAHRSHFYQRVTNLGFSHRDVSVIEYVLAFIQGLLGVAYLWLDSAGRIAVLAFWAVALGLLILAVHRREAHARLAVQG
jgi:UDP-N-acetylmuramyl pentapeptide phosphotransferase/UDP-N-acetylglucosamine-1-phosphate transferase